MTDRRVGGLGLNADVAVQAPRRVGSLGLQADVAPPQLRERQVDAIYLQVEVAVPQGVQIGGLIVQTEIQPTSPPRQVGALGLQVDYPWEGPSGAVYTVDLGGSLGLSGTLARGAAISIGGTIRLSGDASNEPPAISQRHLPTYIVEVAWSRELVGIIRLDTSTLDGTDVLGGFSGAAGTSFDVITHDVKTAHITRGRDSDLSAMQQGTCTLRLADPTGLYNPLNPSSSLAPMLIPMRPVRVRAVHLGQTYGLFRGFITSIEHNPARDARETIIEAGDLFVWLSQARPIVAATGPTTVGAAIGLLLDAIGWSDPSFRSLDAGSNLATFEATGENTALDLIASLLQVDMGDFFIDGWGVAVYRDTGSRWGAGTIRPLPPSVVSSAHPSVDVARVRNTWRVTRTGGVTQVATDVPSQEDYGPRDAQPIESPYLLSDVQAGALANFLLLLYKDPQAPTHQLELWNRDDSAMVTQLGSELDWRVRFAEQIGGTVIDGSVEHLEHEIWEGGMFHRSALLVRSSKLSGFILGTSTLDGSDVLVY